MNKLPYACKELINLYALNYLRDYPALQEFNEICDYEPCKYSPLKLITANKYYNHKQNRFIIDVSKMNREVDFKKERIKNGIVGRCGELTAWYNKFYDNDLFGVRCKECHQRKLEYYKYFDEPLCVDCGTIMFGKDILNRSKLFKTHHK